MLRFSSRIHIQDFCWIESWIELNFVEMLYFANIYSPLQIIGIVKTWRPLGFKSKEDCEIKAHFSIYLLVLTSKYIE